MGLFQEKRKDKDSVSSENKSLESEPEPQDQSSPWGSISEVYLYQPVATETPRKPRMNDPSLTSAATPRNPGPTMFPCCSSFHFILLLVAIGVGCLCQNDFRGLDFHVWPAGGVVGWCAWAGAIWEPPLCVRDGFVEILGGLDSSVYLLAGCERVRLHVNLMAVMVCTTSFCGWIRQMFWFLVKFQTSSSVFLSRP